MNNAGSLTAKGAAGSSLGLAAFRLAAHAYDSLETMPDVWEASRFIAGAIAALVPVSSVDLELPDQVSPETIRFPAGAPEREALGAGGEEIAFQEDDRKVVRCRVEWEDDSGSRTADAVYDLAFAGLILHALSRRVAGQVERASPTPRFGKGAWH